MNEVFALKLLLIIFVPISSDRKDLRRCFIYSDYVRKRNASGLPINFIFVARKINRRVHFQDSVATIDARGIVPSELIVLFLNISSERRTMTNLYVAVEPRHLHLSDRIAVYAHNVRDPLSGHQVGCAVGHHHVLRRDKHRTRATHVGVVVNLSES